MEVTTATMGAAVGAVAVGITAASVGDATAVAVNSAVEVGLAGGMGVTADWITALVC
jgi:hypothetical protein